MNVKLHKDAKRVTVSGKWLKACGFGDKDQTFEVVRTEHFPFASEYFRRMFHVVRLGQPWTVAEGRCINVEEE